MYDIIVYCFTPIEDVFPSIQDVIIVYGHWGKTFVVSGGSSPQDEYNKMYFWVSLGEVDPSRLRGRPNQVLGQSLDVYK